MNYVPGYQWDVFLSYARLDDKPLREGEKGWVSLFVHAFEIAVANYLGEEINLFFDLRDAGEGVNDLQFIKSCAANSALMVSVVSPTYCRREWTLAELEVFCESAPDTSRLFALERLPIGVQDSPPAVIWQKNRAAFWHLLPNARAKAPLRPASERFDDLLLDFADKVNQHLRALKGKTPPPADPTDGPGAPTGPGRLRTTDRNGIGRPPKAGARTVLLAQGTEDVAESIEGVRRYLGQFSDEVRVLPEANYPQDGEDFEQAFGKDLEAADIFVQVLGADAGRSLPDLSTSYTCFQLDAARRANKKIMQWHHRDLDVEAIPDEDYRAVVADPLVAMAGLEEFKGEILREARRAEMEGPSHDPAKVFINADRDNQEIAQSIGYEFTRENYRTAFPKIDGTSSENRIYLDKMMAECGVLVLVHGCPQPAWITTQKRLFDHIRTRRDMDPAGLAVCTVPPGDKLGPEIIGDEFEQIDCSAGFEPGVVRDYIADLKRHDPAPARAGP